MSSILNSISSGDLLVQQVPREIPVKEDSIIDLLLKSEIDFTTFKEPKEESSQNSILHLIHNSELTLPEERVEEPESQNSISNLLQNSEIELTTCPCIDNESLDFNTGFGENNDIHYNDPCQKPVLKVPLYRENYLREFVTEEEKAEARHSLGLYNKGDVVAMSLLTAEGINPTKEELKNATLKQMRKGDQFFAPFTVLNAVFDLEGNSLTSHLASLKETLDKHSQDLLNITKKSGLSTITSLGDVTYFLQGFTTTDTLQNVINDINLEMLRFEKTGLILI